MLAFSKKCLRRYVGAMLKKSVNCVNSCSDTVISKWLPAVVTMTSSKNDDVTFVKRQIRNCKNAVVHAESRVTMGLNLEAVKALLLSLR